MQDRFLLQLLKCQILHLFRAKSSLTYRVYGHSKTRMWHDKNTVKTFLSTPQCFPKLFHLQQSFKAFEILHGGIIPVAPSRNWVKSISIYFIKKKKEKVSCLSSSLLPIHKKNHAYLTDSHIIHDYWRNTFVYICHRVNINRLLWNVWLLLLVNISSKLSTIIDYFEISTFLVDEHKPR